MEIKKHAKRLPKKFAFDLSSYLHFDANTNVLISKQTVSRIERERDEKKEKY